MSEMSLEEFIKHWQSASKDFNLFAKRFILKETVKIRNDAVQNTPTGTEESTGIPGYVGGSLKNSWIITNDPNKYKENTGKQLTKVQPDNPPISEVKQSGNQYELFIINNMHYASHVEYGTPKRPNWKWANGAHMVTKPIEDFQRNKEKDFTEAWLKYAREKGID